MWRKATWALIIFNGLMLLWAISVGQAAQSNCTHTTSDTLGACQAGTAIGSTVAFGAILFIWFIGFVVLSLIWLMTRPAKRLCPQCGRSVKQGLFICRACGYSFVQQPGAQPPMRGIRAQMAVWRDPATGRYVTGYQMPAPMAPSAPPQGGGPGVPPGGSA